MRSSLLLNHLWDFAQHPSTSVLRSVIHLCLFLIPSLLKHLKHTSHLIIPADGICQACILMHSSSTQFPPTLFLSLLMWQLLHTIYLLKCHNPSSFSSIFSLDLPVDEVIVATQIIRSCDQACVQYVQATLIFFVLSSQQFLHHPIP